jgi:L-lactate dehydrogenase complex protein LldG
MAKKSEVLTGIKESTTKEKILKKVRNALISKLDNPFRDVDFNSPIFHELKEEPEVEFVMNLKKAGGEFVYCANEKALEDTLRQLLRTRNWDHFYTVDEKIANLLQMSDLPFKSDTDDFLDQQAGITRCDYLVARFGSVMVSSGIASGRRMFAFPETHIVVASIRQVVRELDEALAGMKKRYSGKFPSQITLITGPSRTADIEKTLVMGAHGPRELYVLMVDDS